MVPPRGIAASAYAKKVPPALFLNAAASDKTQNTRQVWNLCAKRANKLCAQPVQPFSNAKPSHAVRVVPELVKRLLRLKGPAPLRDSPWYPILLPTKSRAAAPAAKAAFRRKRNQLNSPPAASAPDGCRQDLARSRFFSLSTPVCNHDKALAAGFKIVCHDDVVCRRLVPRIDDHDAKIDGILRRKVLLHQLAPALLRHRDLGIAASGRSTGARAGGRCGRN